MKEKKMTQEEFYTVNQQPLFLVFFLANKNKINSLFNVLNVIFFYKKSFSPSYSSKFTKKGYENG